MTTLPEQPEESEESLAIVMDMRDKLLTFIGSSERTSEARDSQVVSLRALIEAVDAKVEAYDEARSVQFDALHEFIKGVDAKMEAHGKVVDAISRTSEATEAVIHTVNQGLAEWMTKLESFEGKVDGLQAKFDGMETKFEGVRDDLSLVKGGHARNAMVHNLARIADGFGFRFIGEVPQDTVLAWARLARGQGESEGDAESFRNADMVINVQDDAGRPGYLAIEASFTVDSTDVRRAMRNAGYLGSYTGLPAYAAVAGVNVMPDVQVDVDAGEVLFYRIKAGELQSE